MAEVERRLAAIVAMDVAGYSRLMGENEQGTLQRLTEHRKFIDPIGQEHGGRIVKTTGDGVLVEFPSVIEAVGFALRCQSVMAERNVDIPDREKMLFRIGINLGDVLVQDSDIFGDGVNVAARIEALAEPGGICISRTVRDNVRDRMDIDLEDMGEVEVKNIARPVRVFRASAAPDVIAAIKPTVSPTSPLTQSQSHRLSRRLVASATVLLAVLLAGGGYWWWQRPDFEPADLSKFVYELPDRPSIAVLPFDNWTGESSRDYLGEGLTENIIAVLSRSHDLFVIARNSSFTYQNKPVKVQQVAEDLGVRYVLEGSVQQSGERLRITAQLVDAIDGKHLWAERYDRDVQDVFQVMDEIADRILVAMKVKLTMGDSAAVYRAGVKELETFLLISRGNRRFEVQTSENHAQAESLFNEALKREPDSFATNLWMGRLHQQKVNLGISKDPKQDLETAFGYANRALEIQEQASAYSLLASLSVWSRNHERAIQYADRAVELGPMRGLDIGIAGWAKSWSGQPEEGIKLMQRSMRLDPFHAPWLSSVLATAYHMVGRYEDAKTIFEDLLNSEKADQHTRIFPLMNLAVIAVQQGDVKLAQTYIKQLLSRSPSMNLSLPTRILTFFEDRQFAEVYLDAMRKAGLPEHPPGTKPEKPSIAVLPFANLSDDKDQEYFADGMTDDLITDLSKVSSLIVIARNSVFTYKGKAVKVQEVAKDLNVTHVFEGSVQRDEGQVRINAKLVDANTGAHLWGDTFDRPYQDIFELQDEVAGKIVDALKVTLTTEEETKLAHKPTDNLEAYELYLKARGQHYSASFEGMARGLELYQEAIDKDPAFAEAYAGDAALASYVWRNNYILRNIHGQAARKRYERSVARALRLEPANAEARTTLAVVQFFDGELSNAIDTVQDVVRTEPNSAFSRRDLAYLLIMANKREEAVKEIEASHRLDPKPNTLDSTTTAWVYFAVRQYEEALAFYRSVATGAPDSFNGHNGLAATYAQMGQLKLATEAGKPGLRIWPPYNWRVFERSFHFWPEDVRDRYIEGLREAGVPEWPYGITFEETDRLSASQLRNLLHGHKISGPTKPQGRFEMTVANNGNWEWRSPTTGWELMGSSRIEDGQLCFSSRNFMRGDKQCAFFYRNPGGSRSNSNEYVYTDGWGVHYFSVVE